MGGADESRRERFLRNAEETRALAQRTPDPKVAAAYLEIAQVWVRMAEVGAHLEEADNDRGGDEAADDARHG
jgi:hypothetical protein